MKAWFWIGVLLAADALFGLAGSSFWARRMPGVPVERIALIEGAVAAGVLTGYFMFRSRGL
jgi:hypothetical protein